MAGAAPETLQALFAAGRPADPTSTLLVTPAGERMSYAAVDRRTAQVARALAAVGVRPGDRVAVQVEKSPLALWLYLACVRAGAVFVPLNPAYTDGEVSPLLRDAEPAVYVGDPGRGGSQAAGMMVLTADERGRGSLADLADEQPAAFDDVARAPDDGAAMLYTSGTTGQPKGALLTHANLAANARALGQVWEWRADDVLLHALPIFHAHGLFVAVNCVLARGSSMVWLPRFDVDAVLGALKGCSVFMGVPTYYSRLLADPRLDVAACRGMRLFVSGSAPLPVAVHHAFETRTRHSIVERYGMTETVMITSNPVSGDRRPGSVGRALPGVDVRITDQATGDPIAAGEVGQVEVRGSNVFPGYWRRPDLTAAEFTPDGFFRTGDLGRIDADGYVWLVGRAKDLIISGGLNVYPAEVEAVLDTCPGVAESAVVGVTDPDFGEAVVAVVVPAPGQAVDPDEVRQTVRGRLAPFKVPKRIEVVEALPRNAMGKIEKARIRERLAKG